MKRIFALLFFATLLNGCDDGNLISQQIDFSAVAISRCATANSDILYKLKDRDALLLRINDLDTALPDVPTQDGAPQTIQLDNSTVQLIYRVYNGTPVVNNVCASIQPTTPSPIEEWHAIAGTIEITTTALKTPNTAEGYAGGETIGKLRHGIVIRNVTWQTPANQIIVASIEFGNFDETFAGAPALNGFGDIALRCGASNANLVYKNSSNTAFAINIDPGLLDTSILNTPKTGIISDTSNSVTYRSYPTGTDLGAAGFDFCAQYATLPFMTEWKADAGDGTSTGIIEVTTTMVGSSYIHSIRLKNTTLRRADGAFFFKVANDYLFGELTQ